MVLKQGRMGDGVEELDRARAEATHGEPLAVGGDGQAIRLDANIVKDIAQLSGQGVDYGDRAKDRSSRHSKDRVLFLTDVAALAGNEEL